MELTEIELKSLEEYASLVFTPSEIAIIVEINEAELLQELKKTESKIYKSFYKGFLITQTQIRKTQLSFALKGNQTCLDRMENLITKINKILP